MLSDFREWSSSLLDEQWTQEDADLDQGANSFGRDQGIANPDIPCAIVCEHFRY
jgi:hypothetical protein